jgi:transposase
MSSQTNAASKLYIGLDIHKRSWNFHFATEFTTGSSKSFPADINTILSFVDKQYHGFNVFIAYEVGCCGYVPARAFIEHGWDTSVVNPADIPRPSKNKFTKTDKIDAKNIALQLRSGNLKKVTIPDLNREALRSFTRQRNALVRDFRRIKSRIKSFLLYLHIDIDPKFETPKWPLSFIDWLKNIDFCTQTNRQTMDSMVTQYLFIDSEIKNISNQIRKYCRIHHKKDYGLLRSIPGIGPLTAAYVLAELGDLRRFTSIKRLASYVGFIPGIYQSGDTQITTGTNPRAKRQIRNLLIEAAWIVLRFDPVMQQYYAKHKGKNAKAIAFKIARKILNRMYAVIKSDTPYQIGIVQ